VGGEAGVPTTLSVMEHALFPETAPPTLGRFEVVRQLGRGGMGVVYLARDPELKRDVAIKVHARGADGQIGLRMRREAEALARLKHRNVVTVHEVGVSDSGDVFVVMEYLPGLTLDRWVAQKNPPAREITAVMALCARGLGAAHDAGLVHRDFKPANVVLDEDGAPKIVDFGLARAGAEGSATTHESLVDESLTQDGALAGTPRYMAPELWRGDPPSPSSDQLAFCVALYELHAGRAPYEPRRFDVAPGRPAGMDLRVWAVLRRGLDPDAHARWASMRELADRLEAAIATRRVRPGVVLGGVAGLVALGMLRSVFTSEPAAPASPAPAPAIAVAQESMPCPIGADLLAPDFSWTGDDPGAIARVPSELRLTIGPGPARSFVAARMGGPPMSFRDRSLEVEVVASPSRGEAHELIFGLNDEDGVFMAGILLMGGRIAFPLAPGLRELSIEIGPRDRFYRIQVQASPGKAETITFETSQDRRTWRPIARTLARVDTGHPMIAIGSQLDMESGDAAVVRAMTCDAVQPMAEVPYERDLSQPRATDEPAR
jgi:predicted Ser/Thr protein kinase